MFKFGFILSGQLRGWAPTVGAQPGWLLLPTWLRGLDLGLALLGAAARPRRRSRSFGFSRSRAGLAGCHFRNYLKIPILASYPWMGED